jgi:hypothetical protein
VTLQFLVWRERVKTGNTGNERVVRVEDEAAKKR